MRAPSRRAFGAPLRLEVLPTRTRRGVVVSVPATGVCRSDWHGWMGHDPAISLPHVPGHELAGVVAAGPEVRAFAASDRVTVLAAQRALRAVPGLDADLRRRLPADFTLGLVRRARRAPGADLNLVRLPESLGFVEAASLGCRFMTAFAAVTEHGRVAAGDWVAVHGCGGVGLSAVMIASALGAAVVAVDVDPDTLSLARSLGAAETVDARARRRFGGGGRADRRRRPRLVRRARRAWRPAARRSCPCASAAGTCRSG